MSRLLRAAVHSFIVLVGVATSIGSTQSQPVRQTVATTGSAPQAKAPAKVALRDVSASTQFKYGSEGDEFDSGKWHYASIDNAEMPEAEATGLMYVGVRDLGRSTYQYHVDLGIWYRGDWRHYSRATLVGGKAIEVLRQGTDVVSCRGSGSCLLSEQVRVVLSKEQFLAGVRFKVTGNNRGDFVVNVPSTVTQELAARAGVVKRKSSVAEEPATGSFND